MEKRKIERTIGFDFGFGNVKAMDNNGNKIIFPTLDKIYNGTLNDNANQKYIVEMNGQNYSVGEFAKISRDARKWDKGQVLDKERISLFLGTALFELSELANDNPDNKIEYINLGTGLPLSYYKTQKNKLVEILDGLEITVTIFNKTKTFKINSVQVMRQAVGAFYSYIWNLDGTLNKSIDKNFEKYGGGLIDMGFKTLDPVRISVINGKFTLIDDETVSIDDHGAFMVNEKVRNRINSDYDLSNDEIFYEDIINYYDGIMRYGREEVNITKYFLEENEELAKSTAQRIISLWKDVTNFGGIIFAGGTAEATKGMYDNLLNTNIILHEDPLFANVKGYVIRVNMK